MINLALYQFDIEFGDTKSNLLKVKDLLKKNKKQINILLLPELFNTGYQFKNKNELKYLAEEIPAGFTTQTLINLAKEFKLIICGGIAEKYKNRFYNSAILVDGKGLIGLYRKVHLFYEEKKLFNAGDLRFPVFKVNNIMLGIMICFDWIFPEAARTLSLKKAQIILHPVNLVLPYCQKAMVTRALENKVFIATCNRIGSENRKKEKLIFTGQSQIVNPKGKILTYLPKDKEKLSIISINPAEANNKKITKYNDLFKDRKIESYL